MEKVYAVKQTVEFSDGSKTEYSFTKNPNAEKIESIVDAHVEETSPEIEYSESPSAPEVSEEVEESEEVSA